MARRRKTSLNPIFLLIPVVLAGGVFGIMQLFKKGGGGFDGVAKLNPRDYFHNNASVQGNTYQITAVVGERIHATDAGRIYSLNAKDGNETIPMTALFSDSLASENIQVGQELVLKVTVDRGGTLRVQEIKRS